MVFFYYACAFIAKVTFVNLFIIKYKIASTIWTRGGISFSPALTGGWKIGPARASDVIAVEIISLLYFYVHIFSHHIVFDIGSFDVDNLFLLIFIIFYVRNKRKLNFCECHQSDKGQGIPNFDFFLRSNVVRRFFINFSISLIAVMTIFNYEPYPEKRFLPITRHLLGRIKEN